MSDWLAHIDKNFVQELLRKLGEEERRPLNELGEEKHKFSTFTSVEFARDIQELARHLTDLGIVKPFSPNGSNKWNTNDVQLLMFALVKRVLNIPSGPYYKRLH